MPSVPSQAIATGQVTMTGAAIPIVAARADRKRVTLVMGGTVADTFVGKDGTVTNLTGVLLAGVKGQTLVFETSAAIFGIGTAAAVVSYIEEFA